MKVGEIQWDGWIPTEWAVITYIRKEHEILLIHKKTGLGAGKINAPGGRIEPGETPDEAAIRETREEVDLEISNLSYAGELFFHFTDGFRLKGTVFYTEHFTGIPKETREAKPFWCSENTIPWDSMWEDDIHWLPRVLDGDRVKGYFIFDGDAMVDKEVHFF